MCALHVLRSSAPPTHTHTAYRVVDVGVSDAAPSNAALVSPAEAGVLGEGATRDNVVARRESRLVSARHTRALAAQARGADVAQNVVEAVEGDARATPVTQVQV